MLHNAHAYVTEKLFHSSDSLLIVGSIIPDLAVTKIIPWNESGLHGKETAKKFQNFIEENNPSYKSLGAGILAHNILDDFTHKKYLVEPGFAYQNNEDLVKLVAEYYGEEGEMAKLKAHNYIESAFDILLLGENPEIQAIIATSIEKTNLTDLSKLLSSYFKQKQEDFESNISRFFDLITNWDLRNRSNWIFFWEDLNNSLRLKPIEDIKIKYLLDLSIKIVEPRYKDFLKYSISEGSKEI